MVVNGSNKQTVNKKKAGSQEKDHKELIFSKTLNYLWIIRSHPKT